MKKKALCSLVPLMDKGVSFYAFGLAFLLVIYMLITFALSAWNFITGVDELIRISTHPTLEHDNLRQLAETNILHTIAFTIVLIKAYRILISYANTQHANIKYLVEISIIAPAIEILFNTHKYDWHILMLFGAFGVANLLVYVWRYDRFKEIGENS